MSDMLEGQVALVTGGGTGVGAATCRLLAAAGARVGVNYSRSEEEARGVVGELGEDRALLLKADVRDGAQVQAMVDRLVAKWGRLDILVNNAAVTYFVPSADLEAMTEEKWDHILDVNLKGAFWCARAAIPYLRQSPGGGRIVNVATVSGLTGQGSSVAYCASKAGLISVTKSLAVALAPEVRVNCVAPGFIDTRWTAHLTEARQERIAATPMGRVATAEDVAEAIVYFAGGATFTTGEVLVLDGGNSL